MARHAGPVCVDGGRYRWHTGAILNGAGAMGELFDDTELALLRSTKPIAVQVHSDGNMTMVEVKPGVVAAVVGGPHVETITGGHGGAFWFNAVEQHRHHPPAIPPLPPPPPTRLSHLSSPLL